LDPACGSGAFPMGMLQKILLVLQKVDVDATNSIEYLLQEIKDPIKRSLWENKLRKLKLYNDANLSDYARKLNIIQNSIFGVDIQPIATEISRLRFFLSLIVDEKIQDDTYNRGIEPLPNLEFKFVCSNSLIPLEENTNGYLFEERDYIDELEEIRNQYFVSFGEDKIRLKNKFSEVQENMHQQHDENAGTSGINSKSLTKKLSDWKPFEDEAADWFNRKWMFGIESGFNIVIGNPPYVDSELMVKIYPNLREQLKEIYCSTKGNWDLYIPFYEFGYKMLVSNGILCFITPNKWLTLGYGKALRSYFNKKVVKLVNCSKVKVFEAGNSPVIVYIKQADLAEDISIMEFDREYQTSNKGDVIREILKFDNWGLFLSDHIKLLVNLINRAEIFIYDIADPINSFTTSEAYKLIPLIEDKECVNQDYFKLVNTGTIDPFINFWGEKITTYIKNKFQHPVIKKEKLKCKMSRRFEIQNDPKIIITGMRHFESFYDENSEFLAGKSTIILKVKSKEINPLVLLIYLNSQLVKFFIKECYSTAGIDGGISFSTDMVGTLPIPKHFFRKEDLLINNYKKKLHFNNELLIATLFDLNFNDFKVINQKEIIKKGFTEEQYNEYKNNFIN